MSESLKKKAVNGVSWSFADNLVTAGVSFLVGIVLARLLSPHEFGILGMITIFIAISTSIIDSGFSNALIRKTDAKDIDYNTVFYFNLFIGIIIYLILFFSAPAISNFFKEPQLIEITRVMGSILLINAIAIIQRTILVKEVDFKTQTKVSVIASVSSGIVGIGMAAEGFGVWSLVGQQISRQFLNTLFLWIYSHWRPALEFSKKSFDELFGFGSKLLLSGLLNTIYNNIYYVVIGHFYSASQLGQYTRAEQFNAIFSSNLTTVVQRVSYPVLSTIQEDQVRLKEAYRMVIKVTMLVTFACMLGLAAIAKPLVLVLIGSKWLQCVSYLQIICFAGMLYPLHAINLNILQVKGRSDLFLKLEVLKKIIGVVPIVLGIFYGIKCMLWGSVFTSFFAYFLNAYYSADLIDYPSLIQIKDILPTFIISCIVAAFMWSLSLLGMANWITLIAQCLSGIILALIIYEKLKLKEYLEIKQIVHSMKKKK
ncbi:lipopolysaccharide biosynthesis protein [uncultured Bacteroides sp.]|uniref:lipopolysaccharide biosynthesis protein n=1 Tax=uncultured Bacteroides sp. TaxID=162156 RepID=UPI002AAC0E13|nr:lipopolysaccharide biosynthesis protein [uncultured Bacteroides sp.]